jgi:hypothetical protein
LTPLLQLTTINQYKPLSLLVYLVAFILTLLFLLLLLKHERL